MPTKRQPDNTAEPVWLGRFPARIDADCRGACGAIATVHAAWLWRARIIVITLCPRCCDIAEAASRNRVSLVHHPAQRHWRERDEAQRT